MRVGIDFRAMQGGHQFRGIGEVLRQGCRQLERRLPPEAEVVAFYEGRGPSVFELVAELFSDGREVSVVELPPNGSRLMRLRDNLSEAQAEAFRARCDVLVQFDPGLGLPPDLPSVLVVHDQIPIILGNRYPATYWPTFRAARNAGMSLARAIERAGRRHLYERNLAHALTRAGRVVTNSRHTAHTTLEFARSHGVSDLTGRLEASLLGVEVDGEDAGELQAMERTRIRATGIDRSPFLLYVGGVDDRRRIDLLVTAFNRLRGDGIDLHLVLAGDSFATIRSIGVERNRSPVAESSYRSDIHLFGFVTDRERHWLYANATAFVFPSEYEGFGLPVLEALARGLAVVTFGNSSLVEVAGPNTELVEESWDGLYRGITTTLDRGDDEVSELTEAGRLWAESFTWDHFGESLSRGVDDQVR